MHLVGLEVYNKPEYHEEERKSWITSGATNDRTDRKLSSKRMKSSSAEAEVCSAHNGQSVLEDQMYL